MKKRLMTWLVIIPLILIAILFIVPHLASAPDDLGVRNGKLKAVPDSPNCVSTFAAEDDNQHYISPLTYTGSLEDTMLKIESTVSSISGFKIITKESNYVHIEATTPVFRYVDDLEIYLDDSTKRVHFRSASRIGQSDLGANRKRVEKLKASLGQL